MVLIVRGHMIRDNVNLHAMKNKRRAKRDVYLLKIGRNIREARKARGISQESLALEAGLDRSYVGGVERGERNISIVNLKKLSDALELKESDFLLDL